MKSDGLISVLLDHGASAGWRIALGAGVAFAVSLVIVVVAFVVARRRKLLHVGPPADPWTGRAIVAAWFAVSLPAGIGAGALIGAGFAAAHEVKATHATERACAVAIHTLFAQLSKDARVAAVVKDGRVPVAELAKLAELAPTLLTKVEHDADAAIAKETGLVSALALRLSKGIAVWLVHSQVDDRLAMVTPVMADLKARDADGDGKVHIDDVVASITRVHLEPRMEHLAFDLVASQGYAAAAIALAVLLVPLLACLGVRKWRARGATTASLVS